VKFVQLCQLEDRVLVASVVFFRSYAQVIGVFFRISAAALMDMLAALCGRPISIFTAVLW